MAACADCPMLTRELPLSSLESVSEILCDLRRRVEHIENLQTINDQRLQDQVRLTIQGAMDNDFKEKTRACVAELQAELEDALSVEMTRRLTEFEELVRMSVSSDENSTPELKSPISKSVTMPDLPVVREEEVEDATEWVGRVLQCVQVRSETCPAEAMDTIQSHVSQDAAKVETPSPEGRQQLEMARHESFGDDVLLSRHGSIGDDVLLSDPHHGAKTSTSLASPSRHVRFPQQLGISSATSEAGRQDFGTLTTGALFEPSELANVLAEAGKANGLSDSGRRCPGNLVVQPKTSSVPELRGLTSQVDIAVEPQSRLSSQRDISACRLPATQQSPRASPSESPRHMRRSIPASQRSPRPSPSQSPRQMRRSMPVVPRSSLCVPGQLTAASLQFAYKPDFQMPQHALTMPFASNPPMPLLMQVGYTRVVAANSPVNSPAKHAVSLNHCSV
eukprot:TRINITY_DN3771_c0_g1_i2.p1 TRINITY_DN3771_c0_g1~~TRINITY_DN3771_c0_g1_i2.p1  ORF type:complete len:449 (-),score=63.35 TRINITY_DN3771_c0_g1_i2:122-1468(-)